MAYFNKLKWILGITLIFVVIVTTNLIDRKNFVQVRDSIVTIYEDRLIAKDLIFKVLELVQEKELAVVSSDSTFFVQRNGEVNSDIQDLIAAFNLTKLTQEESRVLNRLKSNLESATLLEDSFFGTDLETKNDLLNRISSIKENLSDLSEIQLMEGGRAMSISKRALNEVELFTHIEIYLLALLAIVIQIMVIYQPKKKEL